MKTSSPNKLTGYPSIDKPWLKYYSQETIETPLPNCTIYELIYSKNQDNLDRAALDYYGTKFSYREMFQEISYIAGTLETAGIKEGDIVTICMMNAPETVFLIFALNKIGATANMIFLAGTTEELKKNIMSTCSFIIFAHNIFQNQLIDIASESKLDQIIITNISRSMRDTSGVPYISEEQVPLPNNPKFVSWDSFFYSKEGSQQTSHNVELPAVIAYTGGTTGGSKGAVLSNRAVIANAQQFIMGAQDLRRDSTWVEAMPLFIVYGVAFSLPVPLMIGMTAILRIPMADTLAELCEKFNPNHIVYGPAFWEAFADENKELDLSGLIAPITGGDILRPSVEAKINEYLKKCGSPYLIMNGYGMTEVSGAAAFNYQSAHEFGSVGIPLVKNIISAFDIDTGLELTYGKPGEICIQTPSMMSEYVNNPEETENIIRKHEDGKLWVHSGDLGFISEDGFVHITGRLKRYMMYIANGIHKKVFSLDIEKVLLNHPKVDNCAVVPIPDDITFQKPIAFVILKKNAGSSVETELQAYCNENLSDGYRPVQYRFVDKFPLTTVGKVDYLTLEKIANGRGESDNIY